MQKELEFLLNPRRWELLQAISQGKNSASDIAQNLKISIAHANNQLLLLEARGYIKRAREETQRVGKPRTRYAVNKEMIIIGSINQKGTYIHQLKPRTETDFIMSTLRLQDEEDLYTLQKFYYQNEEIIFGSQYMGLLEITPEEIHLLVITENVQKVREEKSTIIIANPEGKKRKIVLWSHTKEEFIQGVTNKETYFLEKAKKMEPYWEKEVKAYELTRAQEEEP